MKIIPKVYLWTRKNCSNFGSHRRWIWIRNISKDSSTVRDNRCGSHIWKNDRILIQDSHVILDAFWKNKNYRHWDLECGSRFRIADLGRICFGGGLRSTSGFVRIILQTLHIRNYVILHHSQSIRHAIYIQYIVLQKKNSTLFKAARRNSAGLYILPLNFFGQPSSDLRDGPAVPCQKYISGRILGVARLIHSDVLPAPALIFTGESKTVKYGVDF